MNLDQLKKVRTIISHDNCADGTVAALFLKDALPEAEVQFVQHGTDAYQNLPATEGMLFCDIAPPAERVQEFVAAGAIVLDHHKTARSVVEAFGNNGIFADEATEPGVSGAVLAYHHVWMPLMGKLVDSKVSIWAEGFVRLTGIRDTWQNKHPRWADACQQAHLMHFMAPTEWLKWPLERLAYGWQDNFHWVGSVLSQRHTKSVAKLVRKAGSYTSAKGTRIFVFNSISHTSGAAETLGDKTDVVVGFSYEVENEEQKLILSTRSHTNFDCSAFTRKFGGGGHTRAAGVAVKVVEGESPYRTIIRLIDQYEAT